MKVTFLGLGTMGVGMAQNILKAGHDLTVYNRTENRTQALIDQGAKSAPSPAEAAAHAEVICICVSDTPDVESLLFGEKGLIHGAKSGAIVVDMSTISPRATVDFAERLAQKGLRLVDAPVSGGSEGAINGTLTIMVGGDENDVEAVRTLLESMGSSITHLGPSGSGQLAKAINQVIISGVYLGVAEGMALGIKANMDMEKLVGALAGGAAGSWVLDNRAQNMVKNEYPLGFRLKLHHKDLRIALDTARQLGATLPVTAIAEQLESGLIASEYGDEDLSALARSIRQLSGIK